MATASSIETAHIKIILSMVLGTELLGIQHHLPVLLVVSSAVVQKCHPHLVMHLTKQSVGLEVVNGLL
jgi:hypothetical protein